MAKERDLHLYSYEIEEFSSRHWHTPHPKLIRAEISDDYERDIRVFHLLGRRSVWYPFEDT